MKTKKDIPNQFFSIMKEAIIVVKKAMLSNSSKSSVRMKKDGNTTYQIDLISEDFFIAKIRELNLPVELITEEQESILFSDSPIYTILLDPIDGSDLVIRGYPLGCISLSFHHFDTMEVIFCMVGDIFQGVIFFADKNGAFCFTTNKKNKLKVSNTKAIENSFIASNFAKSYRLKAMLEQKRLVNNSNYIFNYGGALEITRVASGSIDAFLEFSKGFKSIDYSAACYIAQKAGATVSDLLNRELPFHKDLSIRQRFVVSSTPELHSAILRCLSNSSRV